MPPRKKLSKTPVQTGATIGNHMKMVVRRGLRVDVREFYADILGCKVLASPRVDLDIYEFADGFVLGIYFVDVKECLSDAQQLKATWLEFKVNDVKATERQVRKFGVALVEYEDKTRFYFQAPGGQVFRLASLDGGI